MSATSIAKSRQPAKEQKSQQERREEENLIAVSSMQLLGYKCLTLHEWMYLLSLLKDGSKYQLQPFATQLTDVNLAAAGVRSGAYCCVLRACRLTGSSKHH